MIVTSVTANRCVSAFCVHCGYLISPGGFVGAVSASVGSTYGEKNSFSAGSVPLAGIAACVIGRLIVRQVITRWFGGQFGLVSSSGTREPSHASLSATPPVPMPGSVK